MNSEPMPPILDDQGLNIERFDPALASVLGNEANKGGGKVLYEARRAARIEPRHWLYCLAKASWTLVRTRLIDAQGKEPERFIEILEEGLASEPPQNGRPLRSLNRNTVSPDVLKMLATAQRLAGEHKQVKIDEPTLTFALCEAADPALKDLLQTWATEEGWEKFLRLLRSRFGGVSEVTKKDLWDQHGCLRKDLFSSGGRRLCRRMREDAASLNAVKLTTLHLLYTLLSTETSLLYRTLGMRGMDAKKELHPNLSRRLARPGGKRNVDFDLTETTVLGGVAEVFVRAAALARERGAPAIQEADLSRAFVQLHPQVLTDVVPPGKPLDVTAVRDYMDSADPEEEELDEEEETIRLSIEEIERRILGRIRGQPQAIARSIPWIKRLRFGWTREDRPAVVLLLLGPTGTGKTQLAKELARYVYGSDQKLIFLEMGQFKTRESMNNFIGAPPGYVGYGEGKLTNGLRDMPECVVLFDEIEKADTQVFDTILRFADEGMISDPAGPVRDGRKCIIVMTTNAGQKWFREQLENESNLAEDHARLTERLFDAAMKELHRKGFRPEFLGRVDERITFLPLSQAACEQILNDVLEKEIERLRLLKNVELIVGKKAQSVLVNKTLTRCLDEGARSVPRVVNEFIVSRVIDLLLASAEAQPPIRSVVVDCKAGTLEILEVKVQ